MLDSYTSSMCIKSSRRSSFSRCLIEINVDDFLIESLTIGVPLIEGSGFTIETVTIEYEWKPPHCDLCKIFGHVHDHCPKKVSIPFTVVTSNVLTPTVEKTNDGFQTVGKKQKKGKSKSINGGHLVKQNIRYEPKATTSAPIKGATNLGNASKSSSMLRNHPPKATVTYTMEGKITMSNSYAALDDENDKDVENMYDESSNLFHHTKTGTDIQKESQKRPNQAQDGKDKVNPKPKSVKVKRLQTEGKQGRRGEKKGRARKGRRKGQDRPADCGRSASFHLRPP
ncbi:hypothetical protein Tco_0003747 [Tanacetum coccineum]